MTCIGLEQPSHNLSLQQGSSTVATRYTWSFASRFESVIHHTGKGEDDGAKHIEKGEDDGAKHIGKGEDDEVKHIGKGEDDGAKHTAKVKVTERNTSGKHITTLKMW